MNRKFPEKKGGPFIQGNTTSNKIESAHTSFYCNSYFRYI